MQTPEYFKYTVEESCKLVLEAAKASPLSVDEVGVLLDVGMARSYSILRKLRLEGKVVYRGKAPRGYVLADGKPVATSSKASPLAQAIYRAIKAGEITTAQGAKMIAVLKG